MGEEVMSEKELLKKLAQLESVNDHLITELHQMDQLMRLVGFKEGIFTVKETAKEIIKQGILQPEE